MTENTHSSTDPEESLQESPADLVQDTPAPDGPEVKQAFDESTIGTGTSMALGCIAGTVLLILFGLLFLALSTLR